jgi:hypothetical protein
MVRRLSPATTERQATELIAYLAAFRSRDSLLVTSEPVGASNRTPRSVAIAANVDLAGLRDVARGLAFSFSFSI